MIHVADPMWSSWDLLLLSEQRDRHQHCKCMAESHPPLRKYRKSRALAFMVCRKVLWPVAAVEVHTSREVEALNGTNVRLKCTFSSSSPVGQRLTVTWNFRPQGINSAESMLYYYEKPYPPTSGRFKERVTWDGNIGRNDASVVVWNLNPTDNGTFTCQVKNPPDVDGTIGEIQLRVVQQVHFSEIHILSLVIGSACALMIIVVIVVVVWRHYRNRRQEKSIEMVETELTEKEKLKSTEEKVAVPLED
ncbi:myelin protein zero-like protein 2 isoform X1 [Chelonia mydas]|uniref:myelin protein zero-like protein 2 isoform X1 n=1 Tax=Chelonia mydas TaxID=8469 RepID=UPI001CA81139|nr:myelin protein zero-like protein 2 isoform X1 [Chelonia mydas]